MTEEKAKGLVRKSYEAMKGSNCLEESWLKEALAVWDEKPVCKTCEDTKEQQAIQDDINAKIVHQRLIDGTCQQPASELRKITFYDYAMIPEFTEGTERYCRETAVKAALDAQQQRIEGLEAENKAMMLKLEKRSDHNTNCRRYKFGDNYECTCGLGSS